MHHLKGARVAVRIGSESQGGAPRVARRAHVQRQSFDAIHTNNRKRVASARRKRIPSRDVNLNRLHGQRHRAGSRLYEHLDSTTALTKVKLCLYSVVLYVRLQKGRQHNANIQRHQAQRGNGHHPLFLFL